MTSKIKLKLKLLIENRSQKVLFAETGKDVADLLFSLLALPIGTVIKLITTESMAGSLGATYGSLEQLDDTYLLSSQAKSQFLNPTCSSSIVSNNSLLLSTTDAPFVTTKKYNRCPGSGYSYQSDIHNYVTDAYGTACLKCRKGMTVEVQRVVGALILKEAEEKREKGVVKGVVTYTVMDDLSVVPMSTISSVTLLNKFGIKDLSTLEEKLSASVLKRDTCITKTFQEYIHPTITAQTFLTVEFESGPFVLGCVLILGQDQN